MNYKSLSLFRIALAVWVLAVSLVAVSRYDLFYTDSGVLPTATLMKVGPGYGSLSLYFASRWWWWGACLLLLQCCLALTLLIGFESRKSALMLSYLTYSLAGRNPYLSGLEDIFLTTLLLVSSLLPLDQWWSVQKREVVYLPTQEVALFIYLVVALFLPLGLLNFNLPSLVVALGIFLLFSRFRRSGLIVLLSGEALLFGLGELLALHALALVPLARTRNESSALLPLCLIPLLLLMGAALPAERWVQQDRAVQRSRDFESLSFRRVGQTRPPVPFYRDFPEAVYGEKQYLNKLAHKKSRPLFQALLNYYDHTLESTKTGERHSYEVFWRGELIETVTTDPLLPPVWERFPPLDRGQFEQRSNFSPY